VAYCLGHPVSEYGHKVTSQTTCLNDPDIAIHSLPTTTRSIYTCTCFRSFRSLSQLISHCCNSHSATADCSTETSEYAQRSTSVWSLQSGCSL